MKISVNILTLNNINVLSHTLNVLRYDLQDIDHEIIIVDNGSNDGCEKLATISNGSNLGISKGKNQGIDASKGKFIVLLDGDICPVSNSIPLLIQHLYDNPDCFAIGIHGSEWTREWDKAESFCRELHRPRIVKSHCLYYGAYRRSVFDSGLRLDESGPFSGEGYGYEDLDFWRQMQASGYDQWFASINQENGKYYHEINSSIRVMGRQKYIETSYERHKHYLNKWQLTN